MPRGIALAILLLLGHFHIGLMLPIPSTGELQDASCPVLCTCTSWLLSCIGAGKWRQLDSVPYVRGTSYVFNTVELGENDITTIKESTWLPFRWTETLDLHENHLETLEKDSFEGLILLKKLNLSGNVISKIAGFVFQSLPFLEILDLSGNKITILYDGTFKSWHGLPFLRHLNLNSNPLEVIEKDAFDKLPSMQYLGLLGTKLSFQMMYPAFMAVPNIVQLDLPDRVRCCLCYIAQTIEILFNVKVDCSTPCASDASCDASETFIMINGTVLRPQMSLRNHNILESFLNQNTSPSLADSSSLPRENSLSRSSKLGLLHQIEESENDLFVGNHLNPRLATSKAANIPYLGRMNQRPSYERETLYTPQRRGKYLHRNIGGRNHGSHRHQNLARSVKVPLTGVPRDSRMYGLPVEAGSQLYSQNNFKERGVTKRVKRQLELDQQANNSEKVETTILIIPETTIEQPEVIYEFESIRPDIKELSISTPAEPNTKAIESADTPQVIGLLPEKIIEVGYNVKAKHKPVLRTAHHPRHFSHDLQQVEMTDPGVNEPVTISDESWHKPLGEFLDNAVQKNVVSFSPTPAMQPSTQLSQDEIVRQFKEAFKKYKEANYNQQLGDVTESEQLTTSNPGIVTQEGNNDSFSSEHPKKIIKESVKSSSSVNSKLKTNIDDMFEAKVNEEVRAVEPNKEIQTLLAHAIRIIKLDCLKQELNAACSDLLAKIGHLMKLYEGKGYLPEVGSWNPSLSQNIKDGKEMEIFPPPITQPKPEEKPYRGHERGSYVPNYTEMYTEEPKANQHEAADATVIYHFVIGSEWKKKRDCGQMTSIF
ncbi:leucine-rich repeat-containing protein 37A-like isoform X2 [Narcine bancroftii]|uniref:leucine-rich repeat-containing protein 37A-like isoform X2 n=1 Tax=Narcine bancroftii TaxID=1343680 RepID=UPI0038319F58